MTKSGISIIILTLNGAKHLERLLETFFETNTYAPVELIIIDHGSTDKTSEVVSLYATRAFIRLINRGRNYSFASSCNLGASKARHPHLLFLNNDIIYTSDVIPAAMARLADPTIGTVGVRLDDNPDSLPTGEEPGVRHTGIAFEWDSEKEFYRPVQIRHKSLAQAWDVKSGFYPAVTGAFLLCRKADFKKLGGFCEEYDYRFEDIDFCLQIGSKLKKKCLCINDLSLEHVGEDIQNMASGVAGTIQVKNLQLLNKRAGGQLKKFATERVGPQKTFHVPQEHAPVIKQTFPGTDQMSRSGVSIIILTRNGAQHLERLLESFFETNTHAPVELIIIDHASEDNTDHVVDRYATNSFVRYVKREKNYSFSESNNFAAKKARYPYLLFLNNDIIYTSDVLWQALEKLRDPDIGVVGIRLDDALFSPQQDEERSIQHTGVTFEWDKKYEFYRPVQIRHKSLNDAKSIKNGYYLAVTGAFLLCRKNDFKAIGGFCEDYDYGFEDIDLCLCFRRKLKKSCYCINELSLQHVGGAARKKVEPNTKAKRHANNDTVFKRRVGEIVEGLCNAERKIEGNIESIANGKVRGWVCNFNNISEKINVDIFIDDVKIGSTTCNLKRENPEKNISYGSHAFEFLIPKKYIDNKEHKIKIICSDYTQKIHGRPNYNTILKYSSASQLHINNISELPIKKIPGQCSQNFYAPTILVCAHMADSELYGGELSFLDILDGFNAIGYNIVCAVPKHTNLQYIKKLQKHSIEILSLNYGTWSKERNISNSAVHSFCRIITENAIKAVHANTIMLREPLLAARRMNVPAVVHARELVMLDSTLCNRIGEPAQQIVSKVLTSSDFIIANSETTAQYFNKPDSTFVVPNTVDINAFDIANKLESGTVNVGLISSNIPKKGIHDFVRVAQILQNQLRQVQFLMIGMKNKHINTLMELQPITQTPSNIIFTGYINDPVEAIKKTNIVLNLSHCQESFGRTILEAMAACRPVVVYNQSALAELVRDGKSGFIVHYCDVFAVADRVKKLCLNPDMLIRMGEYGRNIAQTKYSKTQYAERLKLAYTDIFRKFEKKQSQVIKPINILSTNRNIYTYEVKDEQIKYSKNNTESLANTQWGRKILTSQSPNKKDAKAHQQKDDRQVKLLKIKLLNFGFTERAFADLQKIVVDSSMPYKQKQAAWELALWHANKCSKKGACQCLKMLSVATQGEKNKDLLRRAAVLEAECHDILGDLESGKNVIKHALSLGPHADLYLAAGNLESSISQKLFFINKALGLSGISKISLNPINDRPLFDRLRAGSEVIKQPQITVNSPKVTVIVPVYNAERTIQTAFNCILAQTWTNLEVLVVDDCSTDGTVEVVKEYEVKDSRVRLIKAETNQGPYVARNVALKKATGDFVTCHDADDWSHPEKIEIQARHLVKNTGLLANISRWPRVTDDLKFYRRGNPGFYIQLNMSSLMFRRKQIVKELGYWDSVRFGADSEFFDRIKHNFGNDAVGEISIGPLSLARFSEHSLTGNKAFGFPGYPMGARREYQESYLYYYGLTDKPFYEFPQKYRPFPVPSAMCTTREASSSKYRHFNVVLVYDFRCPDNADCIFEEIKAQKREGLRTGLIQMAHYEIDYGANLNKRFRELIDGVRVQMIVYGEEVSCDTLVIRHSAILQERQRYVPKVKARNIKVIIDQTPNIKSNSEELGYNLKRCSKHLQEYFGETGVWYPINPQVRNALNRHHNVDLNYIYLASENWLSTNENSQKTYCAQNGFITANQHPGMDNDAEVIKIIDVKDLCSFTYTDHKDIAVIMPCIDTKKGMYTAEILSRRAGIDCKILIVHDTLRQGFIKTLNDSAARVYTKYIVYLAEDAYPGRGWLRSAYETLEKSGKGLLAFNDGKWRGRIASFGMVRIEWVKNLYGGSIFCPEYKAHKADNELTVIARVLNMHEYNPGCTLLEYDPEKDLIRGSNPEDDELFRKRFIKGFDGLVPFEKIERLAKEYKVKINQ